MTTSIENSKIEVQIVHLQPLRNRTVTRNSAIAEGPRDVSCQLKSCQLPCNSAETTCTTSPEPSIDTCVKIVL